MPAKAKLTTRERTTSNVSLDNFNKGSELSFAEADSNFINLRDQTIAISDGSTSTDIEAGETITFSGASVSGNTVTITGGSSSSSGGNLGDLQVNGTTLEPVTTNNNLILNANGTGNVQIEGAIFETDPSTSPSFTGTGISGGSTASRIEFQDNGTLYHRAGSAFNALSGSGNDLNLYTTAKVRAINATGIVVGNTNIDVEIASQTGGSLTLKTGEADNPDVSGFIKIQDGANQNITITPNGTGKIVLDGLNWPTADGSNGQVLQTDGAGNLSFVNQSGGGGSTGDLSISAQTITGTTSNGDIIIAPNGTGDVQIQTEGHNGGALLVGDGGAGSIGSNGDEDLQIGVNGGDATKARIFFQKSGNGGNIKIQPDSGGKISMMGTLTGDTTSEAGNVKIEGVQIGHDAKITTYSSNQDLEIDASGTGAVSILTQKVMMKNLPTSNPSVAGQLYNDSGTLKISAG